MRPWMCSECARNQPPGRVVTRPPQSHSHFMATQLVTKWSPVQLQVALAAVPSQLPHRGPTTAVPCNLCSWRDIREAQTGLPGANLRSDANAYQLQWEHQVYNNATVVAVPA